LRPPATRLVVGLGNPGPRYGDTRHNVGFMVAAELAARCSAAFKGCPGQARCELAATSIEGSRLLIARPQTFMNRSGDAVAPLLSYYRLGPADLIVVHDDIDQEMGRLKVVLEGGAGGHKGVISIAQSLGTQAFRRVKVGIGRPRYGEDIEQFVLEPFYSDEREQAAELVKRAAQAVETMILSGDAKAMSEFNT
jgi:PTH1 family peptidyl-tRNA hydrolase